MQHRMQLIIGAFRHLSSGSSEEDFECLYHGEIKPLISALYKFSHIPMVLHYSGVLLNWIERRHHELFLLLQNLIDRKQVELLGGGFYEPMHPLIPQGDKIGQIEMLTTYLRRQFGKRPQGCWIPALAWEQNMVDSLNACGMAYSFLSDTQFERAGAKPCEGGFYAPCLTEDQGKLITVFPLSSRLERDLMEGRPFEVMENLAAGLPHTGGQAAVFFRSIPLKNGEIPEIAYHHFFEELSNGDAKIEFSTPGRVYKTLKNLKRLYFPPAWDSGDGGGINALPRQFLLNYPGADSIYTKMIYIRLLINQLRGDKSRKQTALEELWKAQDCEIFRRERGRSSVRKAAYRSLLEAEKTTREGRAFTPSLSVLDINLDGQGEYLFQDEELNCYISPRGASVFELDYLKRSWNYLDSLSPCPEESGVCRRGFSDMLLPAPLSPERNLTTDLTDTLSKAPPTEQESIPDSRTTIPASPFPTNGRRCGEESFEAVEVDRAKRSVRFRLPPNTSLPLGALEIEKTYSMQKSVLSLAYRVKNTGGSPLSCFLIPRLCLSFPGLGEESLKVISVRKGLKETLKPDAAGRISAAQANHLALRDLKNEVILSIEAAPGFDARMLPEEDESLCLFPVFPLSLAGGASWEAAFTVRFSP